MNGYFAGGLTKALADYKAAVRRAGYTSLKTERDPHDAEINYSGGGTTGQIALRETCTEANTTSVYIISRPEPISLGKLQSAATDLVHETANSDATGSRAALEALEAEFGKVKAVLATRAPAQEKTIDHTIDAVDSALKANDSKAAYKAAKVILATVNATAAKLGGTVTITKLQYAAADLVREIEHADKPGSADAFAALEREFDKVKALLEKKAPAEEKTIDQTIEAVDSALQTADFEKALPLAKTILKAVEAAAAKVSGSQSTPATGLAAVIENLKGAARELDQEAAFKDAKGIQRAFDDFHAIYTAGKAKITAKSPAANETIHSAMEKVEEAIADGVWTKTRAATKALIAAVSKGGKLLGV